MLLERWLFTICLRLRSLLRRRIADAELDEELRDHLRRSVEEAVARGMPLRQARRAALLALGGVEQVKERCRDARKANWLPDLFHDLRYGIRLLRKSPGFTAVAVATMALGIGVNTAVFSLADAALLEPLPYPSANRLVMAWERVRLPSYRNERNDPAPGNFADWRRQNSVFEAMAAIEDKSFNLTGTGEPARVEGEAVSASLFSLLRSQPALGRVFDAAEDAPGGPHVVVIGYGLWASRFGRDPRILGKSILLDGAGYTVIGVMPRNFLFPDPANFHSASPEDQLWVPIALQPGELANHGSHYLQGVLARLKPGVTLPQARAQMNGIAERLAERYPRSNTGVGINLVPLRDQIVGGEVRTELWLLLGAAGLVLLIVCANVASLLLARASSRGLELAVRVALGAGRTRMLRQLLTESVLLALLGGGLGLVLSCWAVRILRLAGPPDLPRVGDLGIDLPVLTFSLGISLFAGIIVGLTPAWQVAATNLQESLKGGARESAARSRLRARNLIIIAETALAVIVGIGAGLMLRSFVQLERAPLGFQPRGVLTFRVIPRGDRYSHLAARSVFYRQALAKLAALPGVQSAGAVSFLPLGFVRAAKGFSIEGHPAPAPGQIPMADYDVVSPGYFQTMSVPLLEGRDLAWSDLPQSRPVIVVNQAAARTYWPDADPLGKRIKEGLPGDPIAWLTVVGIVGNAREFDVASRPRPTIYFPVSQFDGGNALLRDWVVRAAGEPLALASAARDAVWSLDDALPVSRVQTMEQVSVAAVSPQRFSLLLLGLSACLALVLAAVGLYGVTSYAVTLRTREIGIRIALGAQPRDVIEGVLAQAAKLTLAGVVAGLGGALILTRLMRDLLYGVSPSDPLTFAALPVLFIFVALLACCIPARRAVRIDPIAALRVE
ncbi:MAG TPA: ABC transporter permease [Candidatus Acidoferrales bacterium]|nr:ABC transporter permease [Candidatus Acidoferrales bacterium]